MAAIILGEDLFVYKGKRFAYEWDCCWLGWSLAQLNPTLLEQKGLLQRAIDNVISLVFIGCMSRTQQKTRRNNRQQRSISRDPDSQMALPNYEAYMRPRPSWLPGLDTDKRQKARLQEWQKKAESEYARRVGGSNDPKVKKEASKAAVQFYAQQVNGEMVASATADKKTVGDPEMKKVETAAAMNYINIIADTHLESKDAQQIRVNVLFDRVNENVIPGSVKFEGMVFIDVFDTTGINDPNLKTTIQNKKARLDYYRHHDIGLVKPVEEKLPPLDHLITRCGLNIDEYEEHWKDFKLEMNGLGFKIVTSLHELWANLKKFLDTNNRNQKISDPLLMQRVLFEILRRSRDNYERNSKKRSLDVMERDDGKFAEANCDWESRGERPGAIDWNIKRQKTQAWDAFDGKRMYTTVYD